MILLKHFNKKYLFIASIFAVSSSHAFNQASMKSLFEKDKTEEIQEVQYKEKYELISLIPFSEGEKLAKEDEAKYMEELKMISMQEFDDADESIEEEKTSEIDITEQESDTKDIEIKNIKPEETTKELEKEVQVIKIKPNLEIKKTEAKIKLEAKKEKIKEKIRVKEREAKTNNYSEVSIYDILAYDQILIEVDSTTNLMNVKAKINNEYKNIQTYQVSTAKKDIEKPLGFGNISKISLKPTWYPTQSTKKSFKKRGITLPNAVPYGHKYNYMGAAKINLTHVVNGKNTYRIHGTLNEKTIGTNESAGCIRMKNDEVLELSSLLNQFASIKSMSKIKVLLK